MKYPCPFCGVIETNDGVQCKFCTQSLWQYESVQGMLSHVSNNVLAVKLSNMLFRLSGLYKYRERLTSVKCKTVDGQDTAMVFSAPLGDLSPEPGGLIRHIQQVMSSGLELLKDATPHDRSDWVVVSLLYQIYYGYQRHVYSRPGDYKYFSVWKRWDSRIGPAFYTLMILQEYEIKLDTALWRALVEFWASAPESRLSRLLTGVHWGVLGGGYDSVRLTTKAGK